MEFSGSESVQKAVRAGSEVMAGLENLSAKSKVLIRKWLNSYI